MAWLSGWTYRKRIYISGASNVGTNYQILLKVGESENSQDYDFHLNGHSQLFPSGENDSGDIRFTSSDGLIPLSLWVEKVVGSAPNRTAYIWVKITDDLSSDTYIYCYYGNSSATNISNGNSVFDYFDDFSTDSLSNYKLIPATSGNRVEGTYNSTEQRIDINTGENGYTVYGYSDSTFQNCYVQCKVKITGAYPDGGYVCMVVRHDKSMYVSKLFVSEYSNDGSNGGTQTTKESPVIIYRKLQPTLVIFAGLIDNKISNVTENKYIELNNEYNIAFSAYNDNLILFKDHSEIISLTDSNISNSGGIGFGIGNAVGYIDNIFVKKFVYPEPSFNYAGVEETQTPIVYDGITVNDVSLVNKEISVSDNLSLTDIYIGGLANYTEDNIGLSDITFLIKRRIVDDNISLSELIHAIKFLYTNDYIHLTDNINIRRPPRLYLTASFNDFDIRSSIGYNPETNKIISNRTLNPLEIHQIFYPFSQVDIIQSRGKEYNEYIIFAIKNHTNDVMENVQIYFSNDTINYNDGVIEDKFEMALDNNVFTDENCLNVYCKIFLRDKRFLPEHITFEYDFDTYNQSNPIIINTLNPGEYRLLYVRRRIIISDNVTLPSNVIERNLKIEID